MNERSPQFITAFVVRSYRGGDRRLVCDLRRPGLGARDLMAVPVLTAGGGPGRFLLLPSPDESDLTEGAEVVVGYLANRGAFVLGALTHAASAISSETKSDNEGEDMAADFDRHTGGIEFDGASLRMRGGAVAIQPGAGKDASVQVNEGTMRVSSNGDASDWAVLARALVAELAVAYEKINALDVQMVVLTKIVQGIVAPVPVPEYSGGQLQPVQTTDIASRVLRLAGDLGG